MFQTDFILFIQTVASAPLNSFFLFITSLGYETTIQAIIISILFGVNFRKGFLLLQLTVVNAVATGFFKNFFALPRPFNVDAAVQTPGYTADPDAVLTGQDADSFWARLPEAAVAHFRMHRLNSFGFPSGHTSSAVALWGAITLLFKNWWIRSGCILLMILIPFSRIYLGRHFPADVLGGYILGGGLLFLFHRYAFASTSVQTILFQKVPEFRRKGWMLAGLGVLAPVVLMGLNVQSEYAAMWLGVNIGFCLIRRNGIPDDRAPVTKRIGRILLAGGFFLILEKPAAPLVDWCQAADARLLSYLIITCLLTLFIWLSTEMMVKLGWMHRE